MVAHRPSAQPPRGSVQADHIRPGEPYEVTRGHRLDCLPSGPRHGGANGLGFAVLATDPAVREAGVNVGYRPDADTLRAPDIAVGNVPDAPGWAPGVPRLAVEYADTGQDEAALAGRITDLRTGGTRFLWVVRLVGPRRVEVYEPGRPMRTAYPGELLEAPGELQNPVRVEELYDPAAARAATLRNLLQRRGYASLDAVRTEGRRELLARLVTRRLQRDLTAVEQSTLAQRLDALGSERLGDVVLDLAGDALATWLADPDAR